MAVAAVGAFLAANAGTIAAATMAGTAIMQGMQARQQAEQQRQYQKQQNELALKSMRDQYSQLSSAEKDAQERSVEESIQNQEEYAQRRARINLMAAASGTGGLSVDSMMQDLKQQKGRNLNTIVSNQEIELQGFRNQAESIRTGTQGRLDNRKIHKPSWAEIGIDAAGSALQGYMTGQDIKGQLGQGGNPSATLGKRHGSLQSQVNYEPANQVFGGV